MITIDELDDPANDFVTADEVAALLDVEEATVRVWSHRGKLTTLGYEEIFRSAVYSRTEVLELAKRRGVIVQYEGITAYTASWELGITVAELLVLVAAGELRITGRSFLGALLDPEEVREFADSRGLILQSRRHEIDLQWREATRPGPPGGLGYAPVAGQPNSRTAQEQQRLQEDAMWQSHKHEGRMTRIENLIEDM